MFPHLSLFLALPLISIGIIHQSAAAHFIGYGAKGQLSCQGHPSSNTSVAIFISKEYDDHGKGFTPLEEGRTDKEGKFSLSGAIEWPENVTNFTPQLRIIHECNDADKPCHVMELIGVPMQYMHRGPKKEALKFEPFYDDGHRDLTNRRFWFRGEWRRTCWHNFHEI